MPGLGLDATFFVLLAPDKLRSPLPEAMFLFGLCGAGF